MPSAEKNDGTPTQYVLTKLRKAHIPAIYNRDFPDEKTDLDCIYVSEFYPDRELFQTFLNYIVYVIKLAADGITIRDDVGITETSVQFSDATIRKIFNEFSENSENISAWHFDTLN